MSSRVEPRARRAGPQTIGLCSAAAPAMGAGTRRRMACNTLLHRATTRPQGGRKAWNPKQSGAASKANRPTALAARSIKQQVATQCMRHDGARAWHHFHYSMVQADMQHQQTGPLRGLGGWSQHIARSRTLARAGGPHNTASANATQPGLLAAAGRAAAKRSRLINRRRATK